MDTFLFKKKKKTQITQETKNKINSCINTGIKSENGLKNSLKTVPKKQMICFKG